MNLFTIPVSVLSGVALALSSAAVVGPVAAGAPGVSPVQALGPGSALSAAKVPGRQIRIVVAGERLGQTASVKVKGLTGDADGYKKVVKVTQKKKLAKVPVGKYRVSARKIQAGGRTASAEPVKIKVTVRRGATARLVYVATPPPPPGADVTAPGAVTGLTVTGTTLSSISLAWTNPPDADLAQVLVRRAVGEVAPSGPTAGTAVPLSSPIVGLGTDGGLSPITKYAYSVFTKDTSGNVSGPTSVTVKTADPVLVASGATGVPAGSALNSGDFLLSPDGRYRLVNQPDGNLVQQVALSGRVLWETGTAGGESLLIMMPDGNLLLMPKVGGEPSWSTGTSGDSPNFQVQNDANLKVFTGAVTAWSSNTVDDRLIANERLYAGQQITSPNGLVRLVQQADGNLVLYGAGDAVLWYVGSYGSPGAWTVMQADGNFVVYAPDNSPLWSHQHMGQPWQLRGRRERRSLAPVPFRRHSLVDHPVGLRRPARAVASPITVGLLVRIPKTSCARSSPEGARVGQGHDQGEDQTLISVCSPSSALRRPLTASPQSIERKTRILPSGAVEPGAQIQD